MLKISPLNLSLSLPVVLVDSLTSPGRGGGGDGTLDVEGVEVQPDLADVGVGPADGEAAGRGVPAGPAGEVGVVERGGLATPSCSTQYSVEQ